ncbi:MAG: AmmeMemoRadiSam system protein A [Clostridia bacterium]|nr:AmmeMemoRadiSam system protein A [Clostridia bacterium]
MNLLKGYIVPHPPILVMGTEGEKAKIEATQKAYEEISKEIGTSDADIVVLITPHGPVFVDGLCVYDGNRISGDFSRFGHREITGIWDNDLEYIEKLQEKATAHDITLVKIDDDLMNTFNIPDALDHGAMVPLHMLAQGLSDKKIVVINYGLLPVETLYQFGQLITETLEEQHKKGIVIASGDLSHYLSEDGPYGFREEGEAFDKAYVQAFEKGDWESLLFVEKHLLVQAGECGKRSIEILLGAFDRVAYSTDKLSYEAPFGVGYMVGRLSPEAETASRFDGVVKRHQEILQHHRANEGDVVKLARKAIEIYLRDGYVYRPEDRLEIEASGRRSGVFVSLKDSGGLRGCIGSTGGIAPTVEEEIVEMAVKAATRDPRFDPVSFEELEGLTISVDILSPSEPVEDRATLDPKKYGVIVSSGHKQGLLLPDLEGIDTIEEQISIALNKAGIDPLNEVYQVYKFTVKRYY